MRMGNMSSALDSQSDPDGDDEDLKNSMEIVDRRSENEDDKFMRNIKPQINNININTNTNTVLTPNSLLLLHTASPICYSSNMVYITYF